MTRDQQLLLVVDRTDRTPALAALLTGVAAELGLMLLPLVSLDSDRRPGAPAAVVLAGPPPRIAADAARLDELFPDARQIVLLPTSDVAGTVGPPPSPRRWIIAEDDVVSIPYLVRAAVAATRRGTDGRTSNGSHRDATTSGAAGGTADHAAQRRIIDALMESGGDALLAVDADGTVTAWNRGAQRLFGLAATAMLGGSIGRLAPELPEGMLMERLREVAGGAPFTLRTTRPDGREIAVELSSSQICEEHHEIGLVMIGRDVTDRLRFEERLLESDRRFRQISENIREVFWMNDPRIPAMLFVSSAYSTIWGRTPQSLYLSSRSFLDSVLPEDRPLVERAIERQRAGEGTEIEYRIVRPDGSMRWIRDRAFPIADAAGRVYRVAGVAEDITERELAARRDAAHHGVTAALASSSSLEEAAPAILETIRTTLGWSTGVLWTHDDDSQALRCVEIVPGRDDEFTRVTRNTTFDRGIGLPGMVWERMEPQWIESVVSSGNYPRWEVARSVGLHAAVAFPIALHGELLAVMEFYSSEVRPNDPETLRTMGAVGSQIGQFIERRRAEEALRRSETRFRTFAETASDAIVSINAASRILYVNPAAEKIFGHPTSELIGSSLTMIMPRYLRRLHELGLTRYLKSGARHLPWARVELEGLRSSGETFPIEVSFGEFVDAGTPIFTGIIRDISDRKRAESERAALLAREQVALRQSETARARLGFLAEASEVLSSSLNVETILTRLAHLAVPGIADWCGVDMLEASGDARRLAVAHVDPDKIGMAQTLHQLYPPDPDVQAGLMNVLRTGRAEIIREVTPEMLDAAARSPEHRKLLDAIGFSSVMIIPLVAHGRTLGAITFVASDPGRRFDDEDLALAEDLAGRAALAVDNALLYREVGRQREWLAVTLASIGDGMIATDTEGRITFLNRAAASMLGLTLEETLGAGLDSMVSIIDEGTREPLEQPIATALRHGKTVAIKRHVLMVTSSGREVPIEDSAAPICDGSGEIIGVVMVFHDTTEERRAERERAILLAEVDYQRRKLDNIIANVPGLVWEVWQAAGREQSPRDFVSEHLEQMLGYTPKEWLETPDFWRTIVHPDDAARVYDEALEILHGPARRGIMRFRWRRKDGSYIWVEAHAVVILDESGDPVGMRGVTMDITERMRWEEELKKAKELAESANAAKDQFLAVLSHELRTPLTPVLSTVYALETDDSVPKEIAPYIEIIRRNVELEARLIDDLLDLTRISKGKIQLNLENVDAHALIRHVLEIVQADVKKKRIVMTVDLAAARHHICSDPARMQQVFWNLIKNGVKFTPDGGRVTIRSRNQEDGRLRVEVADSGIGIEPEVLPKIFDAFEQGEEKITKRFGGLGLGLAITKALVDVHSGTLEASSPGRDMGAVFTVTIATVDSRPEQAGPEAEPEERAESGGALRLLIVDDHEDTSRVMKLLLERKGFRVRTANSMRSALTVAESYPFDLLISDIGLPDGSGIELMEQLRARREVSGIALSGFGMEEDVQRSRRAGFREHLTKPVSFARLLETIQAIVEEK